MQEDQVPQLQLELQERDWVPQSPQSWVWVAPVEQTPWSVQELQADQAQPPSQERDWVPQSPQLWDWVSPTLHPPWFAHVQADQEQSI